MPAPITVTPESMQQAGTQIAGVADEMAAGLEGLRSTITGSGNPWGSDEPGTVFGSIYAAVLGKAFTAIASHVAQVRYAGQALQQQARDYDQTELAIADGFRGAAGRMG